MPKFWAVVTVAAGPTLADIIIDGTFIPIGPSTTGGIGGHRVIDSNADPIPFVFHARGPKRFPVTLGIVLSPLPKGADIKFTPPPYNIPDSGILTVDDGKIPIAPAAIAAIQPTMANVGVIAEKATVKKAAVGVKAPVKRGGNGG